MGENLSSGTNVDTAIQPPPHVSTTSSNDQPATEAITTTRHLCLQPPTPLVVAATTTSAAHFISGVPLPFDPPFELSASATKRARYNLGQWKLIASPPPTQQQLNQSPSPTAAAQGQLLHANTTIATATSVIAAAASSSDTTPSPTPSPRPAQDQAGNRKPEGDQFPSQHPQQFRKGKYVSPVWKPHEMLWLARAWRAHYQGDGTNEVAASAVAGGGGDQLTGQGGGRGKSRAEKDREVAEYLKRQGVNRDAKTAGTKWDNMLGEFRKVYEWERGGEREQVGKSYFRLSPYERKLHRLPASFDEEVFDELSQFMGSRMRLSSSSTSVAAQARLAISTSANIIASTNDHDSRTTSLPSFKALPPTFSLSEEDTSLSAGRTRQMIMASGGESYLHSTRGSLLGFESPTEIGASPSSTPKELRRIGRIRMAWEESVSLWAEEGEHRRGRVKLQGSSFLNADEITYFDDSMIACTMETFEDGPLKGFSVDRFVSGQQIKVFGRRKSSSAPPLSGIYSGFNERTQLMLTEPSSRSISPCELPDPTEYYVGCLRASPTTLPSLFDLSWHIQEPPPEDLRMPLRRDIYRDLPQGKELFFTVSNELLDCRSFTIDILSSLIRSTPSITASTATGRDSFIGLWDDCINRVVSKFCSVEVVFIRKPSSLSLSESLQDQWPNLTGFVKNFCLWRAEETDRLRDGHIDPSSSLMEKILWTYRDLPYVLGYYAIGYMVKFCALSRSQDRVIRTDLYSVDLSRPAERLKSLVPCWRIAGILTLLADRCVNSCLGEDSKLLPYSDFERIDLDSGNIVEMTPNTVVKFYASKRKWAAVKEIYDYFDCRIPHAEYISSAAEADLALVFKPRGCRGKPSNCEQLVEALKHVTKALVALHDLSFMHRDLSWEKVTRRNDREDEWFLSGFEEAVGAPQIYPHGSAVVAGGGGSAATSAVGGGRHAPEMGRGVHGVKVDVWGVGHLMKTCGLTAAPKQLRELQNRCLEQNPEQRPTAADCYHHLLQFQSSLSAAGGSY
ncbi:hypothetical protein Nepgr_010902 [Nepenthes gracilis]|uniref:Protein kinase domain-containing protein n=1 Tax=Nepenthes gracilis TaxID=150966 RepID=A0AAD3SEA6_NEPGR|nr:hypothetical protein Nepgr_010902 [Nepenthes gracilis]